MTHSWQTSIYKHAPEAAANTANYEQHHSVTAIRLCQSSAKWAVVTGPSKAYRTHSGWVFKKRLRSKLKHFQGVSGRFQHLLNQDELLGLLMAENPTSTYLIHSGEVIARELYGSPGESKHHRPDAGKVSHHIAQGAALLLTHLEQLHPRLWDCTERLGETFMKR